MKENKKTRDAFEYYFQMKIDGKTKNQALKELSEDFNITLRTAYNWCKELNWDEREIERSNEIYKQVEKKMDSSIVENKVKYLSIAHKLLDDLIKDGFDIKIKSVRDYDTVARLCLLLQDQPTDNINNNIKINDTFRELFDDDFIDEVLKDE